MNVIIINSHEGIHGELANFYKSPITWNGRVYPTAEHLFHARKYIFDGAPQRYLDYAEIIRKASTPYKAKILGIQLHYTMYQWQRDLCKIIDSYNDVKLNSQELDGRKLQIMYETIRCKIFQNENCRRILLSTSDKYIIKAGHPFWGVDSNGAGENNIGKILMTIRNELQNMKYN